MTTNSIHDLNCPCLHNQFSTFAREYVLSFLRQSHPDKNVFQQLEKRLTATVFVNTGRLRTVRTPTNDVAITASAQRWPRRTSRDIARELGLSQLRLSKVILDDQLYNCTHKTSRRKHIYFRRIKTCSREYRAVLCRTTCTERKPLLTPTTTTRFPCFCQLMSCAI